VTDTDAQGMFQWMPAGDPEARAPDTPITLGDVPPHPMQAWAGRGGKPSPATVPDKPHHLKDDERGGKPSKGTPKDGRKKGRGKKPGPKPSK